MAECESANDSCAETQKKATAQTQKQTAAKFSYESEKDDKEKEKCVTTPGLVSFSTLSPSRKPKPWHIKKKRGIIPDGLVQSRLNHFRMLTNGEGGRNKQLCSTNESPGKRGGSDLNSPKAGKQRKR